MKKKSKSASSNPDNFLSQWAGFFTMYWHMLTDDQKKMYLLMFNDDQLPPKLLNPEDLPGLEYRLLTQHMGTVIKKYREKKKLDQKELADMLQKKCSHLSLIESGEKMFTAVDLARVMKILSIPPEELFIISL